ETVAGARRVAGLGTAQQAFDGVLRGGARRGDAPRSRPTRVAHALAVARRRARVGDLLAESDLAVGARIPDARGPAKRLAHGQERRARAGRVPLAAGARAASRARAVLDRRRGLARARRAAAHAGDSLPRVRAA